MTAINAIFRDGVFQPLEPADLPNNERVTLNFEAPRRLTMDEWLKQRSPSRGMRARYGTFPDSANEIAEGRQRRHGCGKVDGDRIRLLA